MTFRNQIDGMYAAFCHTLPGDLRELGRTLAYRLELAPIPDVPWSEVFGNEVTLNAPALVAEGMPGVHPAVVRDATLAHLLAIVDAFGTDRIEDRQIRAGPDLCELLRRIRRSRDQALARVCPTDADPSVDFVRADSEMLRAIATEQRLLRDGTEVSFDRYEDISLGKQALGFPACMGLARAARWNDGLRTSLKRLLACVWLGLQFQDDVIDWEDDLRRGGAWPVALARGTRTATPLRERRTEPDPIRTMVYESGVMAEMLRRACRQYGAAEVRAEALGMKQLASWARAKGDRAGSLAGMEHRHPGYAVRVHALAPWAAEVLA